jgi:hypothetical protein
VPYSLFIPAIVVVWWYPGNPFVRAKELPDCKEAVIMSRSISKLITVISSCHLWHSSVLVVTSEKHKALPWYPEPGWLWRILVERQCKRQYLITDGSQQLPEYDEAYTFSDEKDNRFEMGALAGIGLQYMPTKKYAISVEGRYTASQTDQQKAYSENQTPRYNDTYSLLLSVQYQLPTLKNKKSKGSKK